MPNHQGAINEEFPVIRFNQYESAGSDDELLLFSAPAKAIAGWAGIPRKGWHVRMLYQRWITPGRERELKEFWDRASSPDTTAPKKFILGPYSAHNRNSRCAGITRWPNRFGVPIAPRFQKASS